MSIFFEKQAYSMATTNYLFLYCFLGFFIGQISGRAIRFYLPADRCPVLWLEGGSGLIFAWVGIRFGWGIEGIVYGFLGVFLLFLSLVDLKKYIIPDNVLLSIFLLYFINENFYFIFLDWIKFFFLFGVAFFLKIGYFLTIKKNGLGWGDVKFFSLCGLWVNLELLPVFLFLSGAGGLCLYFLWRQKGWGPYFPLGPALCLALWIVTVIF